MTFVDETPLVYLSIIPVSETQENEFKALQITNCLLPAVRDFFRNYINGFANAVGGRLWFGIEDDAQVKGLLITEEEKEHIEFVFQEVCNEFIPPLNPNSFKISFIKVMTTEEQHNFDRETKTNLKEKYLCNPNENPNMLEICSEFTHEFTHEKDKVKYFRYVIVSEVLQETAPIYVDFEGMAYVRRDAGIYPLTPESIMSRISGYEISESQFNSRKTVYDEVCTKVSWPFCFINIYSPPGFGKHTFIKDVAQEAERRIFYFDSTSSLSQQEDDIIARYGECNPIIIWDDFKLCEKMTETELKDKFERMINKFNKKFTLFMISHFNLFRNFDKIVKTFVSIQMPEITLPEAAFLVKEKILVTDTELDYGLKLARELYMLSSTTSIFSENMSNIGSNPVEVMNQLKIIPHYQKLEKINNEVFKYLDGLDDTKKQLVAEFYLFDEEIPASEKVEQLFEIGLVEKIGGKYIHYEVVRKFCMEFVLFTRIETEIETSLEYYCHMLENTEEKNNLVSVFVNYNDAITFAMRLCTSLLKFNNNQIKKVGFRYAQRIHKVVLKYDGILDISMHQVHYQMLEQIHIIEKTPLEVVKVTHEDWKHLWSQLL